MKISPVFVLALLILCPAPRAAESAVRTSPPPGTQTRSITHQGATRTYRLHIPSGYDSTPPRPLVFVLHGGEGSPQAAEFGLGFNPLSDQHGFLIVYPQGTANPTQGFGWNDGRVSPRFPGREKVDDVGFIRELITRLRAEFNVDARRIFATGNSNGGFMVQRLGWELSDLLAAIAPCAGTLGTEFAQGFAPHHPVHVLAMHGTADPAVPFFGGEVIGRGGWVLSARRMVDLWVTANGCLLPPGVETLPKKTGDATQVFRLTYMPGPKGAEVVFYRLEGHGHNWPGRAPFGGVNSLAGPSTAELNATEVVWSFFASHPKAPLHAQTDSAILNEATGSPPHPAPPSPLRTGPSFSP